MPVSNSQHCRLIIFPFISFYLQSQWPLDERQSLLQYPLLCRRGDIVISVIIFNYDDGNYK